jgi:hypothetical protein
MSCRVPGADSDHAITLRWIDTIGASLASDAGGDFSARFSQVTADSTTFAALGGDEHTGAED